MSSLTERLNKILDRLTSDDFLSGSGLGNEIPFHAFDYPPQQELAVRDHIRFLEQQIPRKRQELSVLNINLFDLVVTYLQQRGLFDKAVEMQTNRGNPFILDKLKAPLDATKLAKVIHERIQEVQPSMVFLTGIGTAFPLVRTHTLLNSLQPLMGQTPLVLFYPGEYDGQALRLFGLLNERAYYRAFRLVD
ncbi:DUF1788 domain-containing protein [Candidatus Magnetaquicoccus inordinatus]|uniref:DUF1788 domain-containing protein n=1 Tax=Candidatus Magnetaquicoccus inordinatus TaxID=2496818 RepID=UPI00102CFFD4|nr:DUF1788 domain-containing protein [Candidatus Magnetaquicoccus inordinatus]